MDLYIQVGVLLLFLAALSLFIYIYTAPAQQFTQKINSTNQEINDRLVTVENMGLSPFMNNTSAPGTSIYPLIRDSRAKKVAVFVQTKNSQGLIVNYGYQLRPANYQHTKMLHFGNSGVGGGTDFERNYVTTVNQVFLDQTGTYSGSDTTLTQTSNNFGTTAFTGTDSTNQVAGANMRRIIGHPSMTGMPTVALLSSTNVTRNFGVPKVTFSDPTITWEAARTSGRTFSSTGFMYTDQVLKMDAPVNDNFSYADNQGSLYRFNQNSTYYSTLILNANNEVVGVYVEEHGVNPNGAVLAHSMLLNGTITSIY